MLAACPTRGWPDGFLGRRDAFLIVLVSILGYPHTHARRIHPGDITQQADGHWQIGPHPVPADPDPRRCPTCALTRWLDSLGIADGLGRGSARMHLTSAHAPNTVDPHRHQPLEPQRWPTATQLLPSIDRHGWIDDYQPLSTRAIYTRLTQATTRALAGLAASPTGPASPASEPLEATDRGPRVASDLDQVLTELDRVARRRRPQRPYSGTARRRLAPTRPQVALMGRGVGLTIR